MERMINAFAAGSGSSQRWWLLIVTQSQQSMRNWGCERPTVNTSRRHMLRSKASYKRFA